MNRILEFIHNNQLVVAAVILFLAILTYCLFNRYEAARNNDKLSFVIDRLTGACYDLEGSKWKY